MYSKQNKILLSALVGLIALLAGSYIIGIRQRTGAVSKGIYKVANMAEINEVRLQSRGDEVVLKYDGVRWKINNKYDADDQLITVLFATLKKAEPKRLVADAHSDSIRQQIHVDGVLVGLFEGQNKVKEFYVGGNKEKTETYFLDAENGPHLIAIPGYRVYIAGVFELDELGWRNRRVFDFNWHSFKKLSYKLPNDEKKGFVIENQGEGFGVVGLAKTDTAKLYNYLDAISVLTADQFIPAGLSKRYDSLAQTTPLVQIEVTDAGNNKYNLVLYPPLPKDKRILGKKEEGTAALFQQKKIIPILRKKDYFSLE